mgnify:FL=1
MYEMLRLTKRTLKQKGFTVDDSEETKEALEDALLRADQYIRNFCHLPDVPDGLRYVMADMACGHFLKDLYNTGKLDELFGIESGVSSLKIGDTQVSYNAGDASSPAVRVNAMIEDLLSGRKDELLRYRKMCW